MQWELEPRSYVTKFSVLSAPEKTNCSSHKWGGQLCLWCINLAAFILALGFLKPKFKYPFTGMAPLQHFANVKNDLICFQSVPSPIFIFRSESHLENMLAFLCLKWFLSEGAHSLSLHCRSLSPLKTAVLQLVSCMGPVGWESLLGGTRQGYFFPRRFFLSVLPSIL